MMEVEKHSSSFRTLRSYSTKRPRSPETANPTDRPPKRLSLAVNKILPAVVHPQTEFCSSWCGSGNSSRHHSEDWVRQAGGLTIDSPQARDVSCFSSRPSDVEEDVNMTVDAYEFESTRRLPGPALSQTNTPSPQLATSRSPQYSSHQTQHESLLASTGQHFPCPVLSQRALQLPSIDSTPSNAPVRPGPGVQNAESTHPITRPSSPTAMTLSPTPSWNANTVSTTSRKQRFTMGPRADCDKCLLGMKGHWMHFD